MTALLPMTPWRAKPKTVFLHKETRWTIKAPTRANSRVTDFNARQRRIDQKQVTLELDKSSKGLDFSKLIKDGEIRRRVETP